MCVALSRCHVVTRWLKGSTGCPIRRGSHPRRPRTDLRQPSCTHRRNGSGGSQPIVRRRTASRPCCWVGLRTKRRPAGIVAAAWLERGFIISSGVPAVVPAPTTKTKEHTSPRCRTPVEERLLCAGHSGRPTGASDQRRRGFVYSLTDESGRVTSRGDAGRWASTTLR